MKVLVYYNKQLLKPIGGPSGYLYNLYNEVLKNEINTIYFIDSDKNMFKENIKDYLKRFPWLLEKIHQLNTYRYSKNIVNRIFCSKEYLSDVDLFKYDIVHFHNTLDMYFAKDSLKEYKGKVIITSHSPKAYHLELRDTLSKKYVDANKDIINKLDIIDDYAFNRADYILFPVKEATECYINTWSKFNKILMNNSDKFLYLPTGTVPKKVGICRDDFKLKFNIPKDKFLVGYIGRHNEIKGYDDLKRIANIILNRNEDICFVIGGLEGPLYRLEHDNWIEIGWTNDPGSLINAVDCFILPNKETFFDLVMLEVLSIGTPMVVSNTGGNKYFKRFNPSGIKFYSNDSACVGIIEELKKNNREAMESMRETNKRLFYDNFTNEVFFNSYMELLKNIMNS